LIPTAWWKEERGAQIFIDYNQNARYRTIASAYSVRASRYARVSTPLTWDELQEVDMNDFTIATVPARFAALGDVHAGIDEAQFDLAPLLEWYERNKRDRGLGDAPYPPNFPKMEGSRRSRANRCWFSRAGPSTPSGLASPPGGRTRRRRRVRRSDAASSSGPAADPTRPDRRLVAQLVQSAEPADALAGFVQVDFGET